MLQQRIFTAILLGAVFIAGVFWLPKVYFPTALSPLVLLGAWEWSRLANIGSKVARFVYLALVALALLVVWWSRNDAIVVNNILVLTASTWILIIVWMVIYPNRIASENIMTVIKASCGCLLLVVCWLAIIKLHNKGAAWLLYVMILVWVADSAAYFSGSRYGKHKLAPSISPGKSWEGVYGALLAGLLYAFVGLYWLDINATDRWPFIVLTIILIPISILGDLYESMLKREVGLKDSGSLLPGHGGVLDRIDSLSSTLPIFVLVIGWWGWLV